MLKILVVYKSLSGNTKKIAEAIADGATAKCLRVDEVKESDLANVEIIFLGSGIYMGRHHRQIVDFSDKFNPSIKVYIFSTAGVPLLRPVWHKWLRQKLTKNKIKILGETCFTGFDTFGPLRWFAGINQGRPDEDDLRKARGLGASFSPTG